MKKIILFLFLFPAVVFLHSRCEKGAKIEEPVIEEPVEEEEPLIEDDENGNLAVIGIDPCTTTPGSGLPVRGAFIRLISTGDTVVTYNLPERIAVQIGKSIKGIPLDSYVFFPQDKVLRIRLSYEFTKKDENYYPLCLGIYTTSYDKYKENQITIIPDSDTK